MRQTRHMLLLFVLMLSAGTMAQVNETTNQVNRPQRPQGQRPPGNGSRPGRDGRMPGGPGSRSTNITYAGATELTAGATESGRTYRSDKPDESALLISTKDAVNITLP